MEEQLDRIEAKLSDLEKKMDLILRLGGKAFRDVRNKPLFSGAPAGQTKHEKFAEDLQKHQDPAWRQANGLD